MKNKVNPSNKKLTLNKETLTVLNNEQKSKVLGGDGDVINNPTTIIPIPVPTPVDGGVITGHKTLNGCSGRGAN